MNRKQMKRAAIYARNSRWMEQFRSKDHGDEMDFSIERHDREGKFFSKEALEGVQDGMCVFLGARMMAFRDRTGQPPAKMTVTVKIEFE